MKNYKILWVIIVLLFCSILYFMSEANYEKNITAGANARIQSDLFSDIEECENLTRDWKYVADVRLEIINDYEEDLGISKYYEDDDFTSLSPEAQNLVNEILQDIDGEDDGFIPDSDELDPYKYIKDKPDLSEYVVE